jgi:hypothetical protein
MDMDRRQLRITERRRDELVVLAPDLVRPRQNPGVVVRAVRDRESRENQDANSRESAKRKLLVKERQ